MKIIEMMKDYEYICKRIDEVNDEIINYNKLIEETRYTYKAIKYNSIKVKTSKKADSTFEAVEKIIDLYARKVDYWESKLEELFKIKEAVEEVLDSFNSVERKIFELKYIKKMRWWQVADKVNYSEKHCRRLCGQALKKCENN